MTNISKRKRLDPVKTRETILTAALDVFAEKGFDGTSIADIAAVAQVPKSLLQYHFGSKEELWKACLEQKAVPLLKPLDRFLERRDAANLAALVAARFRVFQEHPKVARMLAWASIGSTPLPDFLAKRREQLLQIGALNSATSDLTRLLFALAAMDGWFLYRNLYQRALGDGVADEALADKFLQFLIEAMLAQGSEDTSVDNATANEAKEIDP
jgi:AcrR family transcriptional regulator